MQFITTRRWHVFCADDICAAKKFLFKPKSELKRRKCRRGASVAAQVSRRKCPGASVPAQMSWCHTKAP